MSIRAVAKKVGSAPSSVVKWMRMYERGGESGLDAKPQSGSKSRLRAEQQESLRGWLLEGARAHGYSNELWTLKRVQALIARRFGESYHLSHVQRLLKEWGFSHQQPQRQARERDDEAVGWFVKKKWPALKKKRGGKRRASC